MNLFLIGYRCSGKTTIGQAIAMEIDWPFVDSDLRLIKNSGKQINAIIDTEGWDAFRRMERSTLKQICSKDRQVVATGGGVVLDDDNTKAMKTNGTVFWLKASAETIQKRMLQDKNTENFRPALTDRGRIEEIEDMLLKRNPLYESASDFYVHTDDVPVNEIKRRIIENLNKRLRLESRKCEP
jgi:shikimate kinase